MTERFSMTDDDMFYDREGKPLTYKEWRKFINNPLYKNVAKTQISPDIEVSTVWLGLDQRMIGEGPPLIFETMVFAPGHENDLDMTRTYSEITAIYGHLDMVTKWLKKQELFKDD